MGDNEAETVAGRRLNVVTKEKLEALHRAKLGWKPYPRHRGKPLLLIEQASIRTLAKVAYQLSKHPLPHRGDPGQPFHLLVYVNGYTISVFNNGSPLIELAEIAGEPRRQKREDVDFRTAKGVVNYILRNYGT